MVYVFFFFLTLVSASYNFLIQDFTDASLRRVNSAVNYIDNVRYALERYRAEHPDANGTVQFNDLSLPDSTRLVKRSDSYFLIDDKGFYVIHDKPLPGLANALMEKYSADSGLTPDGSRKGLIGYYHVGTSHNGCLMTVARYPEESQSGCSRPLPTGIPEGALVFTDRGSE